MEEVKKVNHLHLVYIIIIFVIVLLAIWLVSPYIVCEESLMKFEFAATITSIVLALVSIVYSMSSGQGISENLGSMRNASEKIGNASHDLTNIKNALNADINKLSSLEDNVNEILRANEELGKHVNDLLNYSHQTHKEVQDMNELLKTQQGQTTINSKRTKKTPADFDKSQYTIAACIMIYACALTQKEGNVKHFPLEILISEQWSRYMYGYAYSMKGLLGEDIFDVEVKENKTMYVRTFSLTYFKGVNKEELFSKEVLTTVLQKRLDKIEQYFKETKED